MNSINKNDDIIVFIKASIFQYGGISWLIQTKENSEFYI